jgi:hypothetical protein
MMRRPLVLINAVLIAFGCEIALAQHDEQFGLALAELSSGHLESARSRLHSSGSPNAVALLARLDAPRSATRTSGAGLPAFDLDAPIWDEFYDYVEELSKKSEFAFFREVLSRINKMRPSVDLGRLGVFFNAYFSPKSKFLIIYASSETVVLEAASGRLLQTYRGGLCEVYYSNDEKHRLRCVHEASLDEEAKTEVIYEDVAAGKPLWRHANYTHRLNAAFSRDYSQVIVFNYKAGEERCDVTTYRLTTTDGSTVHQERLRDVPYEDIDKRFVREVAQSVDLFPESMESFRRIVSPDGRLALIGDKTAGVFELQRVGSGQVLRKFVFASDVE